MTKKAIRVFAGLLIILFVGGAISGCASMNMKWAQPQRTLESDRLARIQSTRIRNAMQNGVLLPARQSIGSGADLANSMLPGFGLLIVGFETAKANEVWQMTISKVKPLQENVKNIDFHRMINDQLLAKLPAIQWLKVSRAENITREDPREFNAINQIRKEVQTGQEDAVLEIQTHYWLSPHLSTLCVGAKVRIWVKSERNTPIYIGTFLYQSLPVVEDEEAENISAVEKTAGKAMVKWMEANQAAYRFAISQGVREISAMIFYELDKRLGVADFGKDNIRLRYTSSGSLGRVDLDGKIIQNSGNRYWIRANRIMLSLAKDGLLMGDAGASSHVVALDAQ